MLQTTDYKLPYLLVFKKNCMKTCGKCESGEEGNDNNDEDKDQNDETDGM